MEMVFVNVNRLPHRVHSILIWKGGSSELKCDKLNEFEEYLLVAETHGVGLVARMWRTIVIRITSERAKGLPRKNVEQRGNQEDSVRRSLKRGANP
jgi:hypothetical protein